MHGVRVTRSGVEASAYRTVDVPDEWFQPIRSHVFSLEFLPSSSSSSSPLPFSCSLGAHCAVVFLSFISFIMRLYAIIIALIQIIFRFGYVSISVSAVVLLACELFIESIPCCAQALFSKRLNYCTPHTTAFFIAIITRTIKLFSFDLKYHSETSAIRSQYSQNNVMKYTFQCCGNVEGASVSTLTQQQFGCFTSAFSVSFCF